MSSHRTGNASTYSCGWRILGVQLATKIAFPLRHTYELSQRGKIALPFPALVQFGQT
jgi:hypothetical protein